jgi:OOP family OmpA-OmpF porin
MKKQRIAVITVIALLTAICSVMTVGAAELIVKKEKVTTKTTEVVLVKTADNFIIMYDSSSSMADKYADTGMIKIDTELEILHEKNQTLPNLKWQAGIFTHTPGTGATKSFATYLPMQTYNKAKFAAAIKALPAKSAGPTLLAGGLDGLDQILADLKGKTVIFLFTDGQFTKQKQFTSPITVANMLSKKYNVCFYVISSATGDTAKAVVDAVAKITPCSKVIPFYQLLHHPEWLTDALFKVTERVTKQTSTVDKIVGVAVNNILFDFDKAVIKPDFYTELGELSVLMQEKPEVHLTLAGYTDIKGSKEYNMTLSQRRANAVRDYLMKNGIERNRITLSWFGSDNPEKSNADEEGRRRNRRVTSVITGM